MITLYYRPADDAFVIADADGGEMAATNASDLLARKTRDEDAARVGLLRFLDFKDWQAKVAGKVLWPGSAEEAMTRAPRL